MPEYETITAEVAIDTINMMIERCDRRIASYAMKVATDPMDAVSVATDVARYGHEKQIWKMALTVAKGERTLANLEASLSARMLSLCGHGMGTADRLISDKIELACIEDALDQTGAIGVLKKIGGANVAAPERTSTIRRQGHDRMVTLNLSTKPDLIMALKSLVNDTERMPRFVKLAWPDLSSDQDQYDREHDARNVLQTLIEVLAGDSTI